MTVKVGRWYNIPRDNRICKICSKNEIGDEFHYLFICNDIPKKNAMPLYFYRNPNIYKFEQLLNTKNKMN